MPSVSVTVATYLDQVSAGDPAKQLAARPFALPVDPREPHSYQDLYAALKALPEFAGAADC